MHFANTFLDIKYIITLEALLLLLYEICMQLLVRVITYATFATSLSPQGVIYFIHGVCVRMRVCAGVCSAGG